MLQETIVRDPVARLWIMYEDGVEALLRWVQYSVLIPLSSSCAVNCLNIDLGPTACRGVCSNDKRIHYPDVSFAPIADMHHTLNRGN